MGKKSKKQQEPVNLAKSCAAYTKFMLLLVQMHGPNNSKIVIEADNDGVCVWYGEHILLSYSSKSEKYCGYHEFKAFKQCTLKTMLQTMIALDAQRQASNLKAEKHFAAM